MSTSARIIGCLAAILLLMAPSCERQHIAGREPENIFGDQGLGPGQFVYPRAVAVAADGRVFVVDKTARIQRFSPDGEFERSWQMPEWQAGKPTGLTVDARGRVLVADTHYHRVIIYDRDGHELGRFGSEGEGPGQFIFPTSVVVDDEDNFYVSEYGGNDRISKFNPQMEYISSFGELNAGGAGALLRPQNLAFDEEKTLWVVDACHHRICRFTRQGQFLSAFGTVGRGVGQLQYPYDFAFCPDGTILICEFGNNRLQRFDRSGRSLEVWGQVGRKPGQLAYPWGVAIGPEKQVYVVDSGNNRIQMFRL